MPRRRTEKKGNLPETYDTSNDVIRRVGEKSIEASQTQSSSRAPKGRKRPPLPESPVEHWEPQSPEVWRVAKQIQEARGYGYIERHPDGSVTLRNFRPDEAPDI